MMQHTYDETIAEEKQQTNGAEQIPVNKIQVNFLGIKKAKLYIEAHTATL